MNSFYIVPAETDLQNLRLKFIYKFIYLNGPSIGPENPFNSQSINSFLYQHQVNLAQLQNASDILNLSLKVSLGKR